MTPSLEDEGIRARTRKRLQGKMWSEGLTGNLGVGVGELAAEDDLICLCPIEIAAGLVALAEEVADEPLGALIQVLEVGRELGVGIPKEIGKWSDVDLKYDISGEREEAYPRRGRAAEERRKSSRRRACCWPSVRKMKERLGFLEELKEEKGKEGSGR